MSDQQQKSKWGGARERSGRKPLKPADRKNAKVAIRLTMQELQTIRRAASQTGMEFAEWLRQAFLAEASTVRRVLKSKRPKRDPAKSRRPSA